ncbi:MAG: right-handed parallel beta-helix repeat-containing protein [Thermoguttaceae bacterium]
MRKAVISFSVLIALAASAGPAEFHVATEGRDENPGTRAAPLRTIQRAAELAQPGDVITVHEGVYRERINPPRGGLSDAKRIVYQAAPGEKVEIKGSEVIKGWVKVQGDLWKVTLPNQFFGSFNPYSDLIRGDWFDPRGRQHHTGAVYVNGDWLIEAAGLDELRKPAGQTPLWFGQVEKDQTTIWAQFPGIDPNQQLVEINVRRTVFYPDQPGINYISLRGFILRQAATPWAPPTAEQVGLVGTNWSKGWIIEDNLISHSRCSGITLGKYGDQWDNQSGNSAEGYVETIHRALQRGWSRQTIGHHIVRNNTISDCEQTGICGSLGAVWSRITGNHIYNIWTQRRFGGAEMAGIKLHAAIDVLIQNNRIHHAGRALWMDWMAQGTRITSNLCYANSTDDLFVEVNHGPFLVDNNLFLSGVSLDDMSEGGAYVHNLFAGQIRSRPELGRSTPYHPAHSTALAGLVPTRGGDNRFFNNLFLGRSDKAAGYGLAAYDAREFPLQTGGNVYYHGARPYARETDPLLVPKLDPRPEVVEQAGRVELRITLGPVPQKAATVLVTTERLGKARVSGLPYENADGSPLRVDTDYFGLKRNQARPTPGPFENPGVGRLALRVWSEERTGP